MSRILLFLGLKVVEIATIIFVPYYVNVFTEPFAKFQPTNAFFVWLAGLATIWIAFCCCLLVCCIVLGVHFFLRANWRWAGRILKK